MGITHLRMLSAVFTVKKTNFYLNLTGTFLKEKKLNHAFDMDFEICHYRQIGALFFLNWENFSLVLQCIFWMNS